MFFITIQSYAFVKGQITLQAVMEQSGIVWNKIVRFTCFTAFIVVSL